MKRFSALKDKSQFVIYWNKSAEPVLKDLPIGQLAIDLKANQTNPLKRIPETIIFIHKAAELIGDFNPKLLYVGNLDMLRIACKYKKRHPNVKIVYEIADLHRLIVDKQSGIKSIIQRRLRAEEKKAMRDVDLLVVTSMEYYDAYYSDLIRKDKVLFLPNMPMLEPFREYDSNKHPQSFTIGFFGWIRYLEQLEMLMKAAEIADVNILFAGSNNSGQAFNEKCKEYKNVEYLDSFDYENEIAGLYEKVDCVYCVYDADQFNVRVALPNKLYESIYCEKPIIVAKNTYLAELVSELGVGLSVSHDNLFELVEALKILKKKTNTYQNMILACKHHKSEIDPDSYNNELNNEIHLLLSS